MNVMTADPTYKKIYDHEFMVVELLELVLADIPGGPELLRALDLSTLQRAFEQTVDGQARRRARDMVWRVNFHRSSLAGAKFDGWQHLFVFQEFQDRVDYLIPMRLRHYMDGHRIEQWDGRTFRAGDRAPPVLAIVLHTGTKPWDAAPVVADIVTPGVSVAAGRLPDLGSPSCPLFAGDGYLTLDSAALTADRARDDNAAWLLAALENPPVDHVTAWMVALDRRLEAPRLRGLRETAVLWAARTVKRRIGLDLGVHDMADVKALRENGEWEAYLEARKVVWMNEYIAESRAEGIAEGRAEGVAGQRAMLRDQAALKFDAATADQVARRLETTADAGRLADVGRWLIACGTGAELLARMDAA